MIDSRELFPETPEGIKAAQEKAGPDGDWQQHVNWWGDEDAQPSMRTYIAEAVRQDADVDPKLLERVSKRAMEATIDISEVTAGVVVPYSGTESDADLPAQVVVSDNPKDTRANLIA